MKSKVFEERIKSRLKVLGVNFQNVKEKKERLGVAVSGGADSMALLCSLSSIFQDFPVTLHVVTVNHNIRSAEESLADVKHVEEFCKNFTDRKLSLKLSIKTLERGIVEKTAALRKKGSEEAARYLRYKAFSEFIAENEISFLMTAHTEDDVSETFLMKMLSGNSFNLADKRSLFLRPFLYTKRREIEKYLKEKGFSWREDSTNKNEKYFRNRIRHSLIPLLDEKFRGWRRGLSSFREKLTEDEKALWELSLSFPINKKDGAVTLPLSSFKSQNRAVQRRILKRAFSEIGETSRVSQRAVTIFLDSLQNRTSFSESTNGVTMSFASNEIRVKKKEKSGLFAFFAILHSNGDYEFPFGRVTISNMSETGKEGEVRLSGESGAISLRLPLPVCIRNRQTADEIRENDGKKSVTHLFDSWKIPENMRGKIPIITTKRGEILAIIGSISGYKNRVVKVMKEQ